ncbi:MAG TPA: NB-ARC domain-containing protein [Thermoanaerobaculia bacterium]|nr:NB-ARC domain-containing protein [Thermoanaerobaculia bacterium]
MPRPLALPPLRNWQDFEDLCLDLWRRLWNDPDAQKHGRQGQPQAGVDVYGRPEGGREWAGVQCKRLEENLTPKVIEEEVEKARTFEPALSRFIIATTARSDVHCQEAARKITDAGFPVTVVSWDEICHHLEDHPDLLRKYFPALIDPAPTGYRCMAIRPEGFVEREELDQIRDILCGSGASAVGITSALRGAGGFGKTTLAQALCHDDRVRAAYPDAILWTTIGDQASEADRLSRVLDLIRFWTPGDLPHFDTVEAAAARLREILAGRRVLVVVDDAWSPADVQPFRGAGTGLLVTTRLRETLPDGCACVDVDAMRLDEAVKLLTAELPVAEGLRSRLEDLARTLGEWPILLKLVNRTLRDLVEDGLGVEKALDEIGEGLDAAGLEAFDQKYSSEREKAVSRTLEVSLRRLSEDEQRRFEALAIFPEDEDVPLQIVERLWSCSAFEAKQLARRLHRLSLLLSLDLDAGTLRLHDVFRKYLIGRQGDAIAALHQDFLARSRSASGRWADLPLSESYLWRWLPYHLVHGGHSDILRELLLNFRFLAARLQATNVIALIGGFDYLLHDPDLRIVRSVIYRSVLTLILYPEQLAGQLVGRLPEGDIWGWERLMQEARAAGKERLLLSGGSGLLPRRASLLPAAFLRSEHTGSVCSVTILEKGQALSGATTGPLCLWDVKTGACLRTFNGHTGIYALTAVGGRLALSGSRDGSLRLWNVRTGACLRQFEGQAGANVLAMVGEGNAILGSDGMLCLWNAKTGACLRTFEGNTEVCALAAVGERRALSGSRDGTVRLWDVDTGACLRTFERHLLPVTAVTAVGRGRGLSGSLDLTVRLWELETGACLRIFFGHTGSVNALAAVGEDQALSGSGDGTLRLWDLGTGACLAVFTFDHSVTSVAVLNRVVIVGDEGGNVHFLDLILPGSDLI